jgi:hypothetical protein
MLIVGVIVGVIDTLGVLLIEIDGVEVVVGVIDTLGVLDILIDGVFDILGVILIVGVILKEGVGDGLGIGYTFE